MNLRDSNAQDATNPCPDFDLAPLVAFPPEVFGSSNSHNAADAFILSLALAFNDMKGVQWTIVQLDKCRPKVSGPSPEMGQWAGMKLQMTRLTMLILHEILNAIESAATDVFDDECFATALSGLNRRYRSDWHELVALAHHAGEESPVRNYIERVRHNFAAHYYQPKALLKGYQQYFFERAQDELNAHAYASFGDRIEATRFYFADAAAQMGQKMLDPSDALAGEFRSYVLTMFTALRFLIEAYLRLKTDRR